MLSFARPLGSEMSRAGRLVMLAGAVAAAVASSGAAEARPHHRAPEAAAVVDGSVRLDALPPEARTTYRLILAGGPFPYPKDGIVFSNRERSLPRQTRGFYREYTVETPGARNRGARRIVCGGETRRDLASSSDPRACYYTGDHYATFAQIVN